MKDLLQTKPLLGLGIYTIPDMASILGIPYAKVLRWINTFWNDRFGSKYGHSYSWNIDLTKAVNFHTLIELYTFYELSQAGVKTKEILQAHELLSIEYATHYPFANKIILNSIRTDGRKILFEQKDGSIHTIDAAKQFNLGFIREFFKNLDFDTDSLAIRLWPLGKEKSIVCDPHHQFGQPVINGTNIQSEALYRMHLAKEPINFIASLYNISPKNVKHAIEFHEKVA
ncbi:MAG TPA: DUF433 domain-containing protein [Bacteroidales bacterium]|nr:DUF433 domain-containing protein [Bacteroidales bacterium]HQN16777.1 DUF433 domain-containing protein [Bacteroidales bacterium]HQP16397.1 DUF433 domain-containing protein [Bacteroidales bacterium]